MVILTHAVIDVTGAEPSRAIGEGRQSCGPVTVLRANA